MATPLPDPRWPVPTFTISKKNTSHMASAALMQAINRNDKNAIATEMTRLGQTEVVVGMVGGVDDPAAGGPITGWFVRIGDGSQMMLLNCFLVTRVRDNGALDAAVMDFKEIADTISHHALDPTFAEAVASLKSPDAAAGAASAAAEWRNNLPTPAEADSMINEARQTLEEARRGL